MLVAGVTCSKLDSRFVTHLEKDRIRVKFNIFHNWVDILFWKQFFSVQETDMQSTKFLTLKDSFTSHAELSVVGVKYIWYHNNNIALKETFDSVSFVFIWVYLYLYLISFWINWDLQKTNLRKQRYFLQRKRLKMKRYKVCNNWPGIQVGTISHSWNIFFNIKWRDIAEYQTFLITRKTRRDIAGFSLTKIQFIRCNCGMIFKHKNASLCT